MNNNYSSLVQVFSFFTSSSVKGHTLQTEDDAKRMNQIRANRYEPKTTKHTYTESGESNNGWERASDARRPTIQFTHRVIVEKSSAF